MMDYLLTFGDHNHGGIPLLCNGAIVGWVCTTIGKFRTQYCYIVSGKPEMGRGEAFETEQMAKDRLLEVIHNEKSKGML